MAVDQTTLRVDWEWGEDDETVLTVRNEGTSVAISVQFEDTLPLKTDRYLYFRDNAFHLFPGETRRIQLSHSAGLESSFEVEVGGWNTQKQVLTIRRG